MGKVDERNQNVSNILNSLIAKAKDTTYTVDETYTVKHEYPK